MNYSTDHAVTKKSVSSSTTRMPIVFSGTICGRFYCHMYWGCQKIDCLGCLNKFKGKDILKEHSKVDNFCMTSTLVLTSHKSNASTCLGHPHEAQCTDMDSDTVQGWCRDYACKFLVVVQDDYYQLIYNIQNDLTAFLGSCRNIIAFYNSNLKTIQLIWELRAVYVKGTKNNYTYEDSKKYILAL